MFRASSRPVTAALPSVIVTCVFLMRWNRASKTTALIVVTAITSRACIPKKIRAATVAGASASMTAHMIFGIDSLP